MSKEEVKARMAEELRLLRQLVQLATKKKEALYDNDLEALRQVVEKEEEALAVVERFQQLDERQIHYCGMLRNIRRIGWLCLLSLRRSIY